MVQYISIHSLLLTAQSLWKSMCEVSRVAASSAYWFLSMKQEDCPTILANRFLDFLLFHDSCLSHMSSAKIGWLVLKNSLRTVNLFFNTCTGIQHIGKGRPMHGEILCVSNLFRRHSLIITITYRHSQTQAHISSEAVITSGNLWRQSELEKQMPDAVRLMRVFWHANECRCETEHDFHLIYNHTKSSEN